MKALMQEEQTKREEKFSRYHETWKQQMKTTRTRLKQECTEDELGDLIQAVESHGVLTPASLQWYTWTCHTSPALEKKDACLRGGHHRPHHHDATPPLIHNCHYNQGPWWALLAVLSSQLGQVLSHHHKHGTLQRQVSGCHTYCTYSY